MSLSVSVIILTKNEAANLPRCLQALRWCEDIHVIDSGSTDETVNVALKLGAIVCSHEFISFGRQRNWALDFCQTKNPWILFLDADEECTPPFVDALAYVTRNATLEVAGFYCCWKMILDGRWLRRSDSFPKWQLRLLRKGRVRFIDVGHGQREGDVEGRLEYLKEPYLHHAFSKGWFDWIERHNRYSSLEAIDRVNQVVDWRAVVSRHPANRNKSLKRLVSRVPFWPILRFFHAYIFKRGFLDGRPGLDYAVLVAYYEYLIRLKMRESRTATPTSL